MESPEDGMTCPTCGATQDQVRDGRTGAGSQRMRCRQCNTRYTPQAHPHGYAANVRATALRMVSDGINLRRAARQLQVHHTTILHWKRQAAQHLPDTPAQPRMVHQVELDELYTFVGDKKTLLAPDGGGPHHAHDYRMGSRRGTHRGAGASLHRTAAACGVVLQRWLRGVSSPGISRATCGQRRQAGHLYRRRGQCRPAPLCRCLSSQIALLYPIRSIIT